MGFPKGTQVTVGDADVVVFDRRTGEQRTTDIVKATDECPMFALVNKDDNSTKNSAAKDDVVAWARKALAGTVGAVVPAKPK